jgi:hypothetical protein
MFEKYNKQDFAVLIAVIIVLVFLSFLWIIDYISKKFTKYANINELIHMNKRDRYKYTRHICLKCKQPQNTWYYNPFFSYMDFTCSNCENDW